MNCREFEKTLSAGPFQALTTEAEAHLADCARCRELRDRQKAMDSLLRAVPQAPLPPFFQARLAARIAREKAAAPRAFRFRPVLVPLAAAAVVALAAALLLIRMGPDDRQPVANKDRVHPAVPQPFRAPVPHQANKAAPAPGKIYPVWPANDDVVTSDDLTIMASIYPASPRGTVTITVDDTDVSAQAVVQGDCVSISPRSLEPGEHQVMVRVETPDGLKTTASWSFYLLEETS